VTTYYANRLYNTSTATTTKHIFAHGSPIATITSGAGGSAGIALNATTTVIHGGYTSGPTTKNWTHTTSGSNTVSVTVTGATDSIKLAAASFTGADQSSPLDAVNNESGWGGWGREVIYYDNKIRSTSSSEI
jgi:hypothetical protein